MRLLVIWLTLCVAVVFPQAAPYRPQQIYYAAAPAQRPLAQGYTTDQRAQTNVRQSYAPNPPVYAPGAYGVQPQANYVSKAAPASQSYYNTNAGTHSGGSPPRPTLVQGGSAAAQNPQGTVVGTPARPTPLRAPLAPQTQANGGVISRPSTSLAVARPRSRAHAVCTASSPANCDYNPALAGGDCNLPGLKARINARGFQYASELISPILDQEIKKAKIPTIKQCIPQVNGCIIVYNLYVSRYRCPQRVAIYPSCPNRIVVAVQNLDIGVTGNLGGQINILVPIPLSGVIQVNAHQVSLTVELVINCDASGCPSIGVANCHVDVGYLDVCIENGGIIGDLANNYFRGQISKQVKQMLPGQVCAQLPAIINEKINGQLGNIPKSIPLSQMLQVVQGIIGMNKPKSGGDHCNRAPCLAANKVSGTDVLPPPTSDSATTMGLELGDAGVDELGLSTDEETTQSSASYPPHAVPPPRPRTSAEKSNGAKNNTAGTYRQRVVRVLSSGGNKERPHPVYTTYLANSGRRTRSDSRQVQDSRVRQRFAPTLRFATRIKRHPQQLPAALTKVNNPRVNQSSLIPPPRPKLHAAVSATCAAVPGGSEDNPCAGCPGAGAEPDPLESISMITQYLDMSKLNDIYLDIGVKETYATCGTSGGFVVGLKGEFSVGGRGGTPFCPSPLNFPSPTGDNMGEILISDYTVNSLFYAMHQKEFLSVRLTPETPKIGELLKTTCSEGEDYDFDDTEVETDESPSRRRRRHDIVGKLRSKRQDAGNLADLGICLGDLLPAIREKYPNEKLIINIRTVRAPSVVLSSRSGGSATLDILVDANICIQSSNKCVGTIRVGAVAVITVNTQCPGRIQGSLEIPTLQLSDPDGALGLPQDALDNLGSLGKELVQKAGNDALQKGIPISLPSNTGLPINFINPTFRIVDRGLWATADFSISPSLISQLTGGGGIGLGGVCARQKSFLKRTDKSMTELKILFFLLAAFICPK
uniref:BPI2 domain-containing protein n=1 Tax=Acrobeloides nanus TaxID=290746 RepID=A0A914CI18_9BILA